MERKKKLQVIIIFVWNEGNKKKGCNMKKTWGKYRKFLYT